MTKKLLVTFPDTIWKTIEKDVMGKLGNGDSEVIRNMVISYLGDKGYLDPKLKLGRLQAELAAHEIMIATLAQILHEKGLISFDDWQKSVSAQLDENIHNSEG